jgi:hypothetical protein
MFDEGLIDDAEYKALKEKILEIAYNFCMLKGD